ncbi:restriction endonuclease subunit S [Candidatus Poriferisodalis sp.]|uniref:restriction endonuclease subunit S n=1 Tax=Candidatus Poriferisodalis sp. TaxID=3101277 RepID=UPI003C705C7B
MSPELVALGEVCDITMGQAPKGDTYNTDELGWPLIAGAGDFGELHPAIQKFTTAAKARLCEPGDLVLGIRASIGEKVLADSVYCLGRGVAGLRPKEPLDTRYLWHWISFGSHELAQKGRGATFKQVNRSDLAGWKIPLPPIEEQRRIAAVLDAAEALWAKRRQALAKLDILTQAIFVDMFGSGDGEVRSLGDLGEVQGGLQVSARRKGRPIQVPYLRVANVYRGGLELSVVKTLRVSARELARTRLEEGDLLVVEGHGNKDEIGRVGMWDASIDPCVHQNHLIRVRCDRSRLLPRFAEAFMNSWVGRRALLRAANTTSGLNTISTSDVRSVEVPVPALADQQRFVGAAKRIDQHRLVLMRSAAEIDTLFASLQQRAFRGHL